MSTRKQLSLLLSVLIGGTSLVAVVATVAIYLIRAEILHLSRETAPMQVKLAKMQRGFEQISGTFARISAASTSAELAGIESDLGQTMSGVEAIAAQLASTAGEGGDGAVIRKMDQTGNALRKMAHDRIEAHKQLTDANRTVGGEIESVTAVTRALSGSMTKLQESSQ